MNARDVIKHPVVTEKSNKAQAENKVVFSVDVKANKTQIAQAVYEIYGIKPVAVNTINVKPKKKRVGRFEGKTSAVKKAIVKLPEGSTIDIYGSNDNN